MKPARAHPLGRWLGGTSGSKPSWYALTTIAIFLLAAALRLSLDLVNRQANDYHMPVIRIILQEGRLPESRDCAECFQPKLYYFASAGLLRLLGVETPDTQLVVAQFINGVAGILTVGVIWLFLNELPVPRSVKLICFALASLNPKLVGINAQATNDSFVILFASGAIYALCRYLRSGRATDLLLLTLLATFAGLSKGNGVIVIFAVLLVFLIQLVSLWRSRQGRARVLGSILLFACLCLLPTAVAGQYYSRYRQSGSFFATNVTAGPFPDLVRESPYLRPGVLSLVSAYLTFRIVDMIQHPVITNSRTVYPRHRTSLASQIYGRTNFVFFDAWPPSWQTNDPRILWLGRLSLLLALLPTLIVLIVALEHARLWVARFFRRNARPFLGQSGWALDLLLLGYLGFIILYTVQVRDFSTMKAIFVFPAILSVVAMLAEGLKYIWESAGKAVTIATSAALLALVILYVSQSVALVAMLS